MADLVELKFTNSDARPKVVMVYVGASSVAQVMEWYGAFYAGDRYRVTANGVLVEKDDNGAPAKIGGAE